MSETCPGGQVATSAGGPRPGRPSPRTALAPRLPAGDAVEQPALAGGVGDFRPAVDAELSHHVAHVELRGALGDEDPPPDLGVGQAVGDELGDLALALGEVRVAAATLAGHERP